MSGLIGKKLGMTSFFDSRGRSIGCTVIQAGPCYVTQIKDRKKDGYRSIQLSFDDVKPNKVTKSIKGHFDKSKTEPKNNHQKKSTNKYKKII